MTDKLNTEINDFQSVQLIIPTTIEEIQIRITELEDAKATYKNPDHFMINHAPEYLALLGAKIGYHMALREVFHQIITSPKGRQALFDGSLI